MISLATLGQSSLRTCGNVKELYQSNSCCDSTLSKPLHHQYDAVTQPSRLDADNKWKADSNGFFNITSPLRDYVPGASWTMTVYESGSAIAFPQVKRVADTGYTPYEYAASIYYWSDTDVRYACCNDAYWFRFNVNGTGQGHDFSSGSYTFKWS